MTSIPARLLNTGAKDYSATTANWLGISSEPDHTGRHPSPPSRPYVAALRFIKPAPPRSTGAQRVDLTGIVEVFPRNYPAESKRPRLKSSSTSSAVALIMRS